MRPATTFCIIKLSNARAAGDTVIVTGDGNGYMIRYTFTE